MAIKYNKGEVRKCLTYTALLSNQVSGFNFFTYSVARRRDRCVPTSSTLA